MLYKLFEGSWEDGAVVRDRQAGLSTDPRKVHVALYLRSAYEPGYKALDYMREEGRGMFWSNLHAIETAEGVIEAILDGIQSKPPPTNRTPQV